MPKEAISNGPAAAILTSRTPADRAPAPPASQFKQNESTSAIITNGAHASPGSACPASPDLSPLHCLA